MSASSEAPRKTGERSASLVDKLDNAALTRASEPQPLAALEPGACGRVVRVIRDLTGRADRLAALGVTPGALVRVVQTFPGIVFECDQTELAVERGVARSILVAIEESAK